MLRQRFELHAKNKIWIPHIQICVNFSRSKDGVLPQELKPLTAIQQKLRDSAAKKEKEEALHRAKVKKFADDKLLIIKNTKRNDPYCPNIDNEGNCLKFNDYHWALQSRHFTVWNELIRRGVATPEKLNNPTAFLRKTDMVGTD